MLGFRPLSVYSPQNGSIIYHLTASGFACKKHFQKGHFSRSLCSCVVTWTRILFIDNKHLRTLLSKELCLKFMKWNIKQKALILEPLYVCVTVRDTLLHTLLPVSNMTVMEKVNDKIINGIFSFFLIGNSSIHKWESIVHTRCHQNMWLCMSTSSSLGVE